ncbi:MAG: sulfatase-like hydrolase/transferase [Verrucomicrobiales bacterium]
MAFRRKTRHSSDDKPSGKMNLPTRLLVLSLSLALLATGHSDDEKKPNILFIVADDQSPLDLKAYRPESVLETPAIDRLAAEGMVIDGAHHMGSWVGAVCTASRHMIMTGRTVWHIPGYPGRRLNPHEGDPDRVPADLAEHSMAAVFNRAGYATMRTCKQGNSYEAANEAFTVRRDATKRGGTPETGSAWHGDQVIDYLDEREAAEDRDPFLIYFGFSHPHDPRDGTPELLEKYGAVNHDDPAAPPPANPKQPPLPVNHLLEHPFHHGHPGLRDEVDVSGVWERRDERTIRNEIGRQFACSELIDRQIARVLDRLEAMGELDNTYVVYTSDHGMAIGRHGLQGKQNLYEHTWKVPLVVKGPGIAPGTRALGNVYLADVLPTLCELAGVDIPATVEASSFKPVLEGKENAIRDILYGVYSGGTRPGMRCVKKGDWKLIKHDVLDGEVRETQLFNLAENPHEFLPEHRKNDPAQTDLAEDPRHAEKLAEMEALLLAEMRLHDDPYRLWDQPDDDLPAPPEPAAPKPKKPKKD